MTFPFVRGSQAITVTAAVPANTPIPIMRDTIHGVTIGDLLIIKGSYTAAPTPNLITNWARRGFQANGTICGQVFYLKYATAADLSPFTTYPLTFTAITTFAGGFIVLGNVDPVLDLATVDFLQSVGTSNAPTTGTFPSTTRDSLIVNAVATVGVSAVTQPGSFTEHLDFGSTVAAPTTIRCEVASKQQAADGLTGALASSIATSQAWVSGALSIPGPDYPTHVTSTTGTASTGFAATTAKPTGVKAGNELLIFCELEATAPSAFDLSFPDGFFPLLDKTSGGVRVVIRRKYATSVDELTTTTYAVSRTGGTATMTLHMSSTRNVRRNWPIGAEDIVALSSTATPTTSSQTTQLNQALLYAVFAQVGSNTATPPTGMTERTDSVGMETATAFQETAGLTGTKQATYTGAAVSLAALLEIMSPTAQLTAPAMDASAYWGSPEMYMPSIAALDPEAYWGSPEMYFTAGAVGGAPQMMMMGVG